MVNPFYFGYNGAELQRFGPLSGDFKGKPNLQT